MERRLPPPSAPRAHLPTEQRHPGARALDALAPEAALALFGEADLEAAQAVARARPALARAIELVAGRMARGGRLFYLGAGTSGRLAALDAAECPPTFGSAPDRVQAIVAGGDAALRGAVEGAEDDREAARAELEARGLRDADVVLGISAGGTTPFVHAGLEHARARGAATIFLACVPFELAPDRADLSIRLETGRELLAGSTRLKAGTATKLALNALSTLVMARLGHVHEDLMVALDTRANGKLVRRALDILRELAGLAEVPGLALLQRAEGDLKAALVMHAHGLELDAARARLAQCDGLLRRALET
jgi:N-acetylmuramic acid 6-phosphate etherase